MTDTKPKQRYAHVRLEGGSTYIQPLHQLGALTEEIAEGEPGNTWTVVIIEMDPTEYEKLPDFAGH